MFSVHPSVKSTYIYSVIFQTWLINPKWFMSAGNCCQGGKRRELSRVGHPTMKQKQLDCQTNGTVLPCQRCQHITWISLFDITTKNIIICTFLEVGLEMHLARQIFKEIISAAFESQSYLKRMKIQSQDQNVYFPIFAKIPWICFTFIKHKTIFPLRKFMF